MNNFFIFSKKQTQRIKKNLFAKFTSEFVQVLTQILYPPLMIFFWGVDQFGIWLFLVSLTSIFTMLNFNFTDASLQEMSINNQKKKFKIVDEIFQNTFGLIIVNLLVLSFVIFIYFLFFEIDFEILENLNLYNIKIILILLLISVYIDIFNSLLNIGIWHQGKQYISVNILTFVEIISKLSIAFTLIFFSKSSNLSSFIACYIFNFKNNCVLLFFNLFNSYLEISLKKFSKKESLYLIKLTIGHFNDHLSNTIKNSGLIVVIGVFFNPNLVAYISTVKTLFYFFPKRFFNVIDSISLYEYAKAFAKNNIHILKLNHKKHIQFVLLISFLFIFISLVLGPYFYKFWLSGKFEITLLILTLIILDVVINIFRNSFAIILRSTNNMLNIGTIELIISSLVILIYYYLFTLGYKIETSLIVIIFGSIISLFVSIHYVKLFYKNKLINLR